MLAWVESEIPHDLINLQGSSHNCAGPGSVLDWLKNSVFRDPVTSAMFAGLIGIRIATIVLL